MVEEGFDVTAFERNDYIGGLWNFTEEDKTSVLPSTYLDTLAVYYFNGAAHTGFCSNGHQYLQRTCKRYAVVFGQSPSPADPLWDEQGCFTDFPFPASAPSHCTAAEVRKYLGDYAAHFGLSPFFRLGKNVNMGQL